MGLRITTNLGSIRFPQLHLLRYMTAAMEGYDGTYDDFMKSDDWKSYCSEYHDLLHHDDQEGVYLPEKYLENVDYKRSYKVGNSNGFRNSIQKFIYNVHKKQERFEILILYSGHEFNIKALMKTTAELLDLMDEDNEWDGIVTFG